MESTTTRTAATNRFASPTLRRAFGAALGVAAGIGLLMASDNASAKGGCNKKSSEVVLDLFDAIENHDVAEAMTLFADNAVYTNTGLPDLEGKPQIQGFLSAMVPLFLETHLDVDDMLERHGTVMVLRFDTIDVVNLQGGAPRQAAMPVMSYFQINSQGKITRWSDHFDTATWEEQTGIPLK